MRYTLKQLNKRLEELRFETLENPPADWVGFQQQVARYDEVKQTLEIIKREMKGEDDDDPNLPSDVARRQQHS